MKQRPSPNRRAIAMLLAAVALPITPLFAQNIEPLPVPAQTAPPPVAAAPAPEPRVAPPPVVSVAPRATQAAPVAEAEAPAAAPQRRSAERSVARPRARQAAPAQAAATAVATPVAVVPALTPVPAAPPEPVASIVEPAPPPPAEPVADAPVAPAPAQAGSGAWLWLIAGLAVIAAVAGLLAWRRRRVVEDDGLEGYYDEVDEQIPHRPVAPTIEPIPDTTPNVKIVAAPIVPPAALHMPVVQPRSVAPDTIAPESTVENAVDSRGEDPIGEIEKVSVGKADSADVGAMIAASAAPAGRPWLELIMRPMRAGTNSDDAVVEFELTVGNAGGVPARDVRISTWMFAAGSTQDSEMERMLIDPPGDAQLSEVTIAPGDGTRIEAAIALPTAHAANGSMLPVLVADARYTLPDGGEGRTSASFEIGLASGDTIEGFSTDHPTGMREDIDARLHTEPQHT